MTYESETQTSPQQRCRCTEHTHLEGKTAGPMSFRANVLIFTSVVLERHFPPLVLWS